MKLVTIFLALPVEPVLLAASCPATKIFIQRKVTDSFCFTNMSSYHSAFHGGANTHSAMKLHWRLIQLKVRTSYSQLPQAARIGDTNPLFVRSCRVALRTIYGAGTRCHYLHSKLRNSPSTCILLVRSVLCVQQCLMLCSRVSRRYFRRAAFKNMTQARRYPTLPG